ncbi:MAG: hypothetical protein Q8R28_03570 [Dehalococcoidia bacterium]|nr:hypothetical protein [Dehalococcoidia bacterium]
MGSVLIHICDRCGARKEGDRSTPVGWARLSVTQKAKAGPWGWERAKGYTLCPACVLAVKNQFGDDYGNAVG